MDYWDYDNHRAALHCGPLRGTVDLEYPQRGLQQIQLAGAELPAVQLLCVEPPGLPATGPESLLDSYARQRDLVATYAQSPARTVRPQCYWRAAEFDTTSGQATGLELIFSMQSSLLESMPQAHVLQHLPPGEMQRLLDPATGAFKSFAAGGATPHDGSGLFLFTPTSGEWRLVTMIEPSDFVAAEFASATLRYQLFPHSLEKGVIRRARLLALFLPTAENSQELAMECYRQFVAAPLPLST